MYEKDHYIQILIIGVNDWTLLFCNKDFIFLPAFNLNSKN